MEAGNDLFGQLDLDIARIGALLDITLELLDLSVYNSHLFRRRPLGKIF